MWAPRSHNRLADGHHLDPSQIRRSLQEDGYVILRRFFPWDTVLNARSAAATLVEKVGEGPQRLCPFQP